MAKRITKTYNLEFKSQAVKLAQEIGGHKAALLRNLEFLPAPFMHGLRPSGKDD